MYIYSGGVANSTINDGYMYIYSGGVANSTINDGYMYIYSGGVANSTTVNSGGWMRIASGGTANSTTVKYRGSMYISSGGVANSTTVNSGGWMYISSGGVANSTTVEYRGSMYIASSGVADSTTVNFGGWMYISSGGTATEIVENGGYVSVEDWANVTFASNTINGLTLSGDGMTVHSNTVANSTTVNSGGDMYIHSGGVANSTTVNDGGKMYVNSGGSANYVDIYQGGYFSVCDGHISNLELHSGAGEVYVNDGTIINAIVSSGGRLYISSGNSVDITNVEIKDGGYIDVDNGFWDVNITGKHEIYGDFYISNGYTSNFVVSSGDWFYINSGTLAEKTNATAGNMIIRSGGSGYNTNVYQAGYVRIDSGGVANNTTIFSGGLMRINSEGVHLGSLQIAASAVVSAYAGAKIDFTLTDRTTKDGYLINDLSRISGTPTYTITVSADQAAGEYKLAQGAANFTGMITIGNGTDEYGALTVNGDALFCNSRIYILKQVDGNLTLDIFRNVPENLRGSADGLSWDPAYGADGYLAQYRFDNMTAALNVYTSSTAVDTYNLPGKSNFWRVCVAGGDWSESLLVSGTKQPTQPLMMQSDADGDTDLFFARGKEKWDYGYAAEHQGCKGGWSGTSEWVSLGGKNKLEDVFVGSSDASILVLTDDANGDALFVDDVYSAFPDEIEAQARIAAIDEIRAGAGDDVIDLTSQRFEYVGDGVTVYGGLGNDVIWANSGENHLFGDAGNDRIVGGSDDDIIVGGAGNDRMHGGGGSDTFCFGSDWGIDTVEQLADGAVTLWFESGSEDFWDAETLTYSDGVNKVIIKGVTADAVSLRFGDVETAIAGAFENAASEKIFEDQDKALLA